MSEHEITEPCGEELVLGEGAGEDALLGPVASGDRRTPLIRLLVYAVLLTGVFGIALCKMFAYALGTEIHSHVVLIPFVTGWLLWTGRAELRVRLGSSATGAALMAGLGLLALGAFVGRGVLFPSLGEDDSLALTTASYLSFLVAGGYLFLGREWMGRAGFPVFFLVFMIPLPEAVLVGMEHALMAASAEITDWLFALTGTPVYRIGQSFQLPGFALEVAQECSGIRSSWVLFMTSLLAAHLFLRANWRRAIFVAMVIPLGILRNGFRILTIGLLCVHQGPHMIDHWIHHRGGPVFFLLSLIPLFGLLWWLRRDERPRGKPDA